MCLLLDTRKRKISPTFFCLATQSEENLSFPSVTRKFSSPETSPALPAFTADHSTDPLPCDTNPDPRLSGCFLTQKGEGAAPAPNQPGSAQAPFALTALEKLRRSRTPRSGLDAGRCLQHLSVCLSSRWAGLSWETQNQRHKLEVKVLRTSAQGWETRDSSTRIPR